MNHKKIVCYISKFSKFFTVVKKNNMVYGRTIYGLGSNVSVEYTACIFRRLYEDGCSMFIQNSIHTNDLVYVSKDTISLFFGLK
jgi:hypothetical protein